MGFGFGLENRSLDERCTRIVWEVDLNRLRLHHARLIFSMSSRPTKSARAIRDRRVTATNDYLLGMRQATGSHAE